jgi:hypothetical protein
MITGLKTKFGRMEKELLRCSFGEDGVPEARRLLR